MSKSYFIKCSDCTEIAEIYPTQGILGVRCPFCGSCDYKTTDEDGEEL